MNNYPDCHYRVLKTTFSTFSNQIKQHKNASYLQIEYIQKSMYKNGKKYIQVYRYNLFYEKLQLLIQIAIKYKINILLPC